MYQERGYETIIAEYLSAVGRSGSGIALDTNQGSVIYTLARTFAAVATKQDSLLLSLTKQSSLNTATGSELDEIGGSYLVFRQDASYSVGYVSVINQSAKDEVQILSPQTVLIEPKSGAEYFTTNESLVSIPRNAEVQVPVISSTTGSLNNIPASTRLYSLTYDEVRFIAGLPTPAGYVGDIGGGTGKESDFSYRRRIQEFLGSANTTSEANIKQVLLNYPLIEKVFVVTRVGGIVEIWVDSDKIYTESQKQELLDYIRPYLSAGIIPYISQVSRKNVDFEIKVQPFRTSSIDLDVLTQRISDSIDTLISSLTVGSTLTVESIVSLLQPLAQKVNVIKPSTLIQAGVNEILTIGSINVSYPAF